MPQRLRNILHQIVGVRKESCGRLCDDSQAVEPGDLACMLCRLLLRIAKVGWTCHHAVRDYVTELSCRVLLDLLQYVRGNVLSVELSFLIANAHLDHRSVLVVLHQLVMESVAQPLNDGVVPVPANESFRVVHGEFGVVREILFTVGISFTANYGLAIVEIKINDRWRRPGSSASIFDD